MKNKVGIGILTCDRLNFFKRCIESIPLGHEIDCLLVVNDGNPYKKEDYPTFIDHVIQNPRNLGVACSKNIALRKLIEQDCDHIFLMEDDIFIKDPTVFEKYIQTAATTGIWHLNYGLHGNYNRRKDGSPIIKMEAEYDNGIKIALYHNILGAFSYYYKNVIKHVGYMDERFHNAFEHVEHTYRILLKGLHPPFWYFADIANSQDYIGEQTEAYEGSKIRNEKVWKNDMVKAMAWFKHKHGSIPQQIPQAQEADVQKSLEELERNYARKVEL